MSCCQEENDSIKKTKQYGLVLKLFEQFNRNTITFFCEVLLCDFQTYECYCKINKFLKNINCSY